MALYPIDLVHPQTMDSTSGHATIAGAVGAFVTDDEAGAIWEVRVGPERLAQILAVCGAGRSVQVATAGGSYTAMARRWWVLPAGNQLLVRVALEKSAS